MWWRIRKGRAETAANASGTSPKGSECGLTIAWRDGWRRPCWPWRPLCPLPAWLNVTTGNTITFGRCRDGREGKIVRQAAPGKGMPATGSGTIRDYPRRTGACLAKRSRFPSFVSGAPADVAAASAALLKSSAATAAAHANRMETWNTSRPVRKQEARNCSAGCSSFLPSAGVWLALRCAICALCHRGSGNRSSIPIAFRGCSRPRSATSCAAPPGCRWLLRRMADPKNLRLAHHKTFFAEAVLSGNHARRFQPW